MIPLPNTATVTAIAFMGVGSRYERDDQQGLAHFTEHMVFKGGKRYANTQEITQALDGVGGEFNAYTSHEYTGFYTKTAAQYLSLGLDVISDMLLNARFPADELEKEKGVIIEELNMYEDIPMRKVDDVTNHLLFGDTPLGRPIIGTKASVTAFTVADFQKYVAERYVGAACTVVVAGSFEPSEAEQMVKQYFGEMPAGEAYRPQPAVIAEAPSPVRLETRKSEQSHLVLAVQAFPSVDPRRYALRLLSSILGGNMSSRLFVHVREEQGLCYYVRSSVDSCEDVGFLNISAGIDNSRLELAVRAIVSQLKLVRDEGVSENEMARAKQYLIGHTLMEMEDSSHVAEYYAAQDRLEHTRETPAEIIAKLEAVTVADVAAVAQEIIQEGRLRLAVVGPQEDATPLEAALQIS